MNLSTMKKHIREYVIDSIHNHKWVYYKHFDDMLEKFQTFEYTEDIDHLGMDTCWDIFTVRYMTDNWNVLTISDYDERRATHMTEYIQTHPNIKDPWNTDILTSSALLKNYIHSQCYDKLSNELYYADCDSMYLTRSRDEWRLIYQARFRMLPYENLWFDRIYNLQTSEENTFYHKFRDLSQFAHLMKNPQPTYTIYDIPLDFFPRDRSRPKYGYAYSRYWIDNGEIRVVPELLSTLESIEKGRKDREEFYNKMLEKWDKPTYTCIIS